MPLTHIWIWIRSFYSLFVISPFLIDLYIERVNSLETLERTVFFANRYCDYPIVNLVPTVIERGKNSYNSYSRLLFQFVPKVSRRIHYSLRYSTCVRLFGTSCMKWKRWLFRVKTRIKIFHTELREESFRPDPGVSPSLSAITRYYAVKKKKLSCVFNQLY